MILGCLGPIAGRQVVSKNGEYVLFFGKTRIERGSVPARSSSRSAVIIYGVKLLGELFW